jgi:hypothetical protein
MLLAVMVAAGAGDALAQTEGPSAAYAFSEPDGDIAADFSTGGSSNAIVNGAVRTAGRFGGGLQFDGVDDAVQLPLTSSLLFSGAFTVEAWVAPSGFGIERRLWWTSNAMLTVRADGSVVPVAVLTGGQVGFVSEITLRAGVWSHVAVTYDGSTLRLFIDGVDAGSRPATGTLDPPSQEPGIIGGAPGFAGKIDEVRFYRRAISRDEVRLDATTPVDQTLPLQITAQAPQPNALGVTQPSVSVTFSRALDSSTLTTSTLFLLDENNLPVPATVAYESAKRTATLTPLSSLTPLRSYTVRVLGGSLGIRDALGSPLPADAAWTFRAAAARTVPSALFTFAEAAGAIAIDRSGNGNDAARVDGASWVEGRIGGGVRLDGVNGALLLPNSQTLAFTDAFTVEAWIAPAALDRERYLWWTPSAMMSVRPDGTIVPVAVLSNGQVGFVSNSPVSIDYWSHVAMIYDGSVLRLYINGLDAGSRPATGTLLPAPTAQPGIVGGVSGFAGLLDELRLYRRALTVTETVADMAVAPGPVAPFRVVAVTPADSATLEAGAKISATFSRGADPATLTAATMQLRDSASQILAASIAYDAATSTATLTPAGPLAAGATYFVRIVGGSAGVKEAGGGELAGDVQWSFRTPAAVQPPPLVPQITAVDIFTSPSTQTLIVKGSNFGARQGTSTVTMGGTLATVLSWGGDSITATLPRRVSTALVVVTVDGEASNGVMPRVYSWHP